MTMKYMIKNNEQGINEIFDDNTYIKVIWEDTLDNHSRLKEKQIEKYFQAKYGTTKVKVIYTPISNKTASIGVNLTADASELVLDDNYQKQLIEKYVKDNNVQVSLNHINQLDNKVNLELENYKEHTNRYKTFRIKEVKFSNFLSYGDDNRINFSEKKGIISVTSSPENFGGKTTLTVDLLLFLFFGTTTKTDKMEDVFNKFTDKDIVDVSGNVEIESDEYMINRTIVRKMSKDGSYTYKSELNFFQVLPRGGVRKLNGEQRKFTEELIKTYIGTFDDFLITILTTGDNLDALINTKPTERGRILTRFIGLEFFREKEKIAKDKYNEWKKTSKLYKYNLIDITPLIDEEQKKINSNNELMVLLGDKLSKINNNIQDNEVSIKNLYMSRHNNIDTQLYQINEEQVLDGISKLEGKIKSKELEISTLIIDSPEPKELYNVDEYGLLKGSLKEHTDNEITYRIELTTLKKRIESLKNSEVCELCKQSLKDIDHTHEYQMLEPKIAEITKVWEEEKNNVETLTYKIENFDKLKNVWDEYNRNKLLIDKYKLELAAYTESLRRGNELLKKYRDGKVMIIENKNIDTEINLIENKNIMLKNEKDSLSLQINGLKKDNDSYLNKINEYNDLVNELKREAIMDKVYATYLDIYGKNGISKMVLSTMIPIINSHLTTLLSDCAEFNLELRMNEKTEVEFWMVDYETGVEKTINSGSGYEKTVSSLALRCVLTKVCSLPKPNIIVFDEITGKVANTNLDKIGEFFEKLKTFFDNIWIISHNPIIKDWADHVINIKKEQNISKLVS